jgi:hypothetical protein
MPKGGLRQSRAARTLAVSMMRDAATTSQRETAAGRLLAALAGPTRERPHQRVEATATRDRGGAGVSGPPARFSAVAAARVGERAGHLAQRLLILLVLDRREIASKLEAHALPLRHLRRLVRAR